MRLKASERLGLRSQNQGLTLIELMVVVVVLGALGAIAIPSYRQYSMRAQRTEAKTSLLQLATNQERFYLQNNTYTNNLAALGFPGGTTPRGVYQLQVPVANNITYQAQAVPIPGGAVDMTADAECQIYFINAQGARTAGPDPNQACW